ncbi:MAG: type I-MYXAN CRISPR-associated protein Cas6/Cmx6 [Myxococcales bacterium]|nr:type I-MYXAN CRISPR-associated protein Cas6/Cmx6 [Myxococcota bacterium]MDW8284333.1 type I-MYXAN CRISPR-associated protein Cas6/Cmx6 [Myxococcales bacterium]
MMPADVLPLDVVDLVFPLRGRRLPMDHGYLLYGALCRVLPSIHDAPWLGVHPVRGRRRVDGMLSFSPHAQLVLRLPAERIPEVLPLAGKALIVGGNRFFVGAPRVQRLIPAASLDARLVVIRLTQIPRRSDGTLDKAAMQAQFLDELLRQLERLDVRCSPQLTGRQEIVVHDRRLLGWSVRLCGLDPEASLRVQAYGLGGKRALGCGVFVPTRGKAAGGR